MFTPQETAEVLKLVQASQKIEVGCLKLTSFIEVQPDGSTFIDKVNLSAALAQAAQQPRWISQAIQNLISAYENNTNGRLGRAIELPRAWAQLDGVIRTLQDSVMRLKRTPEFVSASEDFNATIAILQSIDRTLPYAEPFPVSYPRIVGPHGDYDKAQANVALSVKYLIESCSKMLGTFLRPDWPNTAKANRSYGRIVANLVKSLVMWNRVMCLQADVVLPEDQAAAEHDFEASTRLRPPSFFRAVIAHQLVMARVPLKSIFGRHIPVGGAGFFRDILGHWRIVLAQLGRVNPEFLLTDLEADGGSLATMPIFWSALDDWSLSNFDFFHEIPPIPGQPQPDPTPTEPAVIPLGQFASQVAALDAVKADAQAAAAQAEQVKAELLAMEGKPL
jgi:hypothetical protein